MEQEIRNSDLDNRDESTFSNDRLESFAAAEMSDRGPKAMTDGRGDTDAASTRPVTDLTDDNEDYDDDDEDMMAEDEIEIDEVDADKVDDAALVEDVDLDDDDDLDDLDLDDDDDEEDDTKI